MRAALIEGLGEPPAIGEWEEPSAGQGQAVLELELAGMNPVDLAIASGKFDAGAPPLPYIAGREGIGVTAEGERLYFDSSVFPFGSMAERTVVEHSEAIEVPPEVASEQAIAFGIAGLAAWLALEWRGRLEPGETVLILGASGAVGQIAVQAARLLGARRVVGAARNPESHALIRSLGADAVVSTEGDDLTEQLKQACEGGADLVVDALWGLPAVASIGAINHSGRLVQVGNSAGQVAELPGGPLRGGNVSILGHRNFHAPAEVKASSFVRMCEHAAAGELEVEVEVSDFDQVAETWQRQSSSPGHKLAVRAPD